MTARRTIIVRLLLLLIGGAILNVAVAWGQAYRATDLRRINAILKERVNPIRLEYTEEYYAQRRTELPPDGAGWPMRSLYRTIHMPGATGSTSPFETGIDASRFATRAHGPFVLPVLPLWPGFAINTILYAAMLWLLFAVTFAIRKRRRIKRGLCPACAYPVGASEVCTECGAKVKGSST